MPGPITMRTWCLATRFPSLRRTPSRSYQSPALSLCNVMRAGTRICTSQVILRDLSSLFLRDFKHIRDLSSWFSWPSGDTRFRPSIFSASKRSISLPKSSSFKGSCSSAAGGQNVCHGSNFSPAKWEKLRGPQSTNREWRIQTVSFPSEDVRTVVCPTNARNLAPVSETEHSHGVSRVPPLRVILAMAYIIAVAAMALYYLISTR